MKLYVLLVLIGLSAAAFAQEIVCPSTGLPISQDPGCWARENEKNAQQQQPQQQLPPQPTGYWEKTWGAMAPSSVGGVLGTAVGASSKEEAERIALEDCKAKRGGACKVDVAYYNQCAAMVLGEKTYSWARAATVGEAEDLGMDDCKKSNGSCSVYYSACTEPIFHKY